MKLFDWILLLLLFFAFFVLVRSTHGMEVIILNRADLPPNINLERLDVLDKRPDGAKWGKDERDKNIFLIVTVPDDTPDIDKFGDYDGVKCKYVYKINIDSMTTTEKADFADNKLKLNKEKAGKLIIKKDQ